MEAKKPWQRSGQIRKSHTLCMLSQHKNKNKKTLEPRQRVGLDLPGRLSKSCDLCTAENKWFRGVKQVRSKDLEAPDGGILESQGFYLIGN